ncbi:hypothetical protein SPACI_018530 [Sporomusa acidovorans DSM 3132]|uniref:Methyl-accepting transducer domain-containing protein n=2 Tax=Sporomusa TaxID=2375 RepID=A0ABZ3J0G8_SPOA4
MNLNWPHQVPKELAERVVQLIFDVTGNNVNFMGENGEIIATKQPERLGTIHAGAQKIMAGEVDEIAITVDEAKNMQGVKAGYNGVIQYHKKRIGCIGISGDPEQVRPLQKMAAIIVTEEIKKIQAYREREALIKSAALDIEGILVAIQDMATASGNIAVRYQQMEEQLSKTEENLKELNNILDFIQTISGETNLLGLNAAIEAARVGDNGRGFAAVANEIRKLATYSADSVNKITRTLQLAQTAMNDIGQAVRETISISQQESSALQNVSNNTYTIQEKMRKIT